jgi:hypothetical protein
MMTNNQPSLETLEKEIALREAALKFKTGLPHLYGQKFYRWQRKHYESTHKYTTLVASNQSGKSAANIRKCIRWATDMDLWKKLWKKTPTQFWYLYPTGETATTEFENKWVREFLPKDEMKNHPVFGWEKKMRNGDIEYVRFRSGVTVYFKSYSQDVHSLQAGSCFAIFADEEVPFTEIIPELQMRIAATDGYMNFVFTATRGQEEWRRIVEEKGKLEMWKSSEVDILKQQVSAYDCLYYEDGSPSEVWTVEKIEQAKAFLFTDAQIQRRIYGKFVKDEGLKYPCFSRARHFIPYENIDLDKGQVYAGLDYGSGTNHQSSICLVWASPDHQRCIVFHIWVGEKGIPTTAGDVILKYRDLLAEYKLSKEKVLAFYDWSAADLKTIGTASGFHLEKADKNHSTGERILNTLFKNDQLLIMERDGGDQDILAKQLESLTTEEKKNHAWDDACDSLRYAITKAPLIYTNLKEVPLKLPTSKKITRHEPSKKKEQTDQFEEELNEWNDIINFSDSEIEDIYGLFSDY